MVVYVCVVTVIMGVDDTSLHLAMKLFQVQ